jgi:hypothetical protein
LVRAAPVAGLGQIPSRGKATVTVKTVGLGRPFTINGVNLHCMAASTAA